MWSIILKLVGLEFLHKWQQMRAIRGRIGAYLDGKPWSTDGDIFLSKAAQAGLGVCGHGSESEEAVLRWILLKVGEG